MEIIKVTPRGYCKGVVRAINMAKEAAKLYKDQPIYVLGMLVHNKYVMQALEQDNIKAIDDKTKTRMELLDAIDEGIVIFTAHGISDEVIEKAKQKGLICIDASCPDVVKTQTIVKEHLIKGYEILYIGKKNHPEAEAVCAISDKVHLIQNIHDINDLNISAPVFVTNQTTMSFFDVESLFSQIKNKFDNAVICEEICNATRIRQEAVASLKDKNIDILYVVGDPHSNNSNRLAQIASEAGINQVYLIEDVYGIKDEQLENINKVAVTSGASTPTYLTNQVITYLGNYPENKVKPAIHLNQIL